MNDIEKKIREKGLAAPRVTPESLEDLVTDEAYHRFPGTTVTVCCLTLKNGFNVVGHSAAASPENFDEGIGQEIARAEAINQAWPLEGYLLRQKLHENSG